MSEYTETVKKILASKPKKTDRKKLATMLRLVNKAIKLHHVELETLLKMRLALEQKLRQL